MGCQKVLFGILLITSLIFTSSNPATFAFECALKDTSNASLCTYLRPSIDTIHTFAIYCCGATSPCELPLYHASVWQTTGESVPQFFTDNSMGKYVLTCDVIKDGNDPIQHDSLNPIDPLCQGGGEEFARGIFQIADERRNFANYDGDGDAIVDGFFFIIVGNYPIIAGCPCLGDFSYKTNDTTATGDTVEILGQRGIEIRALAGGVDNGAFIHACVHLWGLQFGLEELTGC